MNITVLGMKEKGMNVIVALANEGHIVMGYDHPTQLYLIERGIKCKAILRKRKPNSGKVSWCNALAYSDIYVVSVEDPGTYVNVSEMMRELIDVVKSGDIIIIQNKCSEKILEGYLKLLKENVTLIACPTEEEVLTAVAMNSK